MAFHRGCEFGAGTALLLVCINLTVDTSDGQCYLLSMNVTWHLSGVPYSTSEGLPFASEFLPQQMDDSELSSLGDGTHSEYRARMEPTQDQPATGTNAPQTPPDEKRILQRSSESGCRWYALMMF